MGSKQSISKSTENCIETAFVPVEGYSLKKKTLKRWIRTKNIEVAQCKYFAINNQRSKIPFPFDCAFSGCTGLISVIIPDGVTDINSRTFSGCSGLTAITVGKGVTFIEASAFNGCSGLTNITLSDKVTYIGDAAFSDCSSRTSITIGNGLAYIGYGVFNGCTELEKVYYKGTAEEWKKISVGGENRNLTGATRYYYSEAKPTASGNYWHYKENGEIEEW